MKKLIPLLLSIVLTFSFLCALPIVTVADTVSTTTGAKYHGKLDSQSGDGSLIDKNRSV
ncbi:MAG: hypothetical protein ACI4IL_01820 [Eubacterium sp.]